MRRQLRWYGASPLHLLALLACFGLAGYAAARLIPSRPLGVAAWFLGAVIGHDLLLMPLYSLADRSVMAAIRHSDPQLPVTPWINYVRVPAALSGLLLLVWFPLILRLPSPYHASTTLSADPYVWHWLAVTGALFLLSAVAFALRLRGRPRVVRPPRRRAVKPQEHPAALPPERPPAPSVLENGIPGTTRASPRQRKGSPVLIRANPRPVPASAPRTSPARPAQPATDPAADTDTKPARRRLRIPTGSSRASGKAGRRTFVNAQMQVVLIAAGCTGAVGVLGTGVIRLLRRAPLRISVQVSGTIVVLAVVAGTLGTAEAMFVSPHDLGVVVMVCLVAAVIAAGFGCLLGRQVEAGSLALRRAARSLGDQDDGYLSPAGPLTAELAALSRELAVTGEKLKESRAREHALDRSRRQLVAWVSHDLRTPLAGLHAMAEALADGIASDPDRYHRQIRAEVGRLARMVDDLFELSRIEAGALPLSPGQIALEDLISDALDSTEALARARGVRLTGETRAPLAIQADPRELSRALTNLLVNAIRHTPADGSVHVMAVPRPDGALLAVADGCGGIPEADLARVFDTAWRGARTGPGTDGGAGLGLAIVRGIVEAHRGQVSVVNTREGCRFEVRLPALASAPASQ